MKPSRPTNLRVVPYEGPTPPYVPPVGRSVLQASDLTFVGGFQVPTSLPNGESTIGGRGLSVRTVNGVTRIGSFSSSLFEMNVPALSTSPAAFAIAGGVKVWGNLFTLSRSIITNGVAVGPYGLFWDESSQRMYWAFQDGYKTRTAKDPSIGRLRLDDVANTMTSEGYWKVGLDSKQAGAGLLAIPTWAQQQYGMPRLAAGFGGYWSVVSNGPASMGGSLFAFDPTQLGANGSLVPSTVLLNYIAGDAVRARMQRTDLDYSNDATNSLNNVAPIKGIGSYTWDDYLWQGGAWVDTPTKTGVVFVHNHGNGLCNYANSTLNAQRGSHWIKVFDPSDLAAVATGAKLPYQIQPVRQWAIQFPSATITYPIPGWSNGPAQQVAGVAFDVATARLYVYVANMGAAQTGGKRSVIYVYQVTT